MAAPPGPRRMTPIDLSPSDRPLVSVVIVTFGGWRWTGRALEALREHTHVPFETIVVDNASPDGTARRLQEEVRGATLLANDENLGFAAAADQGATLARGEYLVFLNPDALVTPGWLPPLLEVLENDRRAGAAVPLLLNSDGTVQEAGGLLFSDGRTALYGSGDRADRGRYRFRRYVDYGSGACLVLRRRTFLEAGGFDPVFTPAYCEDVDLLLTLRMRGLLTVFQPGSEVIHVRFGASATGEERMAMSERNTRILAERWRTFLATRPPLPRDPTDVHLVLASRDADATDRILVVDERIERDFLRELAARNPLGRVTYLATDHRPPDEDVVMRLGAAGVEIEGPVDGPDGWWRERMFHYTAIVIPGDAPSSLRGRVRATQPQASLIAGLGLDASLAELRRVGLLVQPEIRTEQSASIR
jgi:GT2 family glycosyltransferase